MVRIDYSIGVKIRQLIDTFNKKNNVKDSDELIGLNKNEYFLENELDNVGLYINKKGVYLTYNNLQIPIEISKLKKTNLSWLKNIELMNTNVINKNDIYELFSSLNNLESLYIERCELIDEKLAQLILNSNLSMISLSIIDQDNIRNLNLNNNTMLKNITLINNDNLFKIYGLDKLYNMQFLTFIDNQEYESIDDICTLASRSDSADIDVLYFLKMKEMIGNDIDSKNKIQFCETIHKTLENELKETTDKRYLKYSFNVTQDFYNRAREIINTYISDDDTLEEKHAIIHQWLCDNITYDFERLKRPDLATGMKDGTNGIINAFLHKQVICEGFAKLEQLLLQMCGIKSSIVTCKCQYKGKLEPHGILFISFPNGKFGYNDVTFDASSYQRGEEMEYLLLSKDEISKDHFLIGQDNRTSYGSGYTKEQANRLIKFAQDRIKAVNEKGFKVNNVNNIINEIQTLYGVNINSMDSFDVAELLKKIRKQTNMHEIDYKTGHSMIEFLEEKERELDQKEAQASQNEENSSVVNQSVEKKESIFDKIRKGKMSPKNEYKRYVEDLKKYHSYNPAPTDSLESEVHEREQLISSILESSSFGELDDIMMDKLNKMSLEELREFMNNNRTEEVERRRMM